MKKLYRSSQDKYLFGILGGLGEYLNTDATLLRLLFVFFVLITGLFPGVLAYIIALFIVPEDPHAVHVVRNKHHSNQDHQHHTKDANKAAQDAATDKDESSEDGAKE